MPGGQPQEKSVSPVADEPIDLFEALPVALAVLNSGGQITKVNAEAERMFGYLPGELVGSRIEVLIPGVWSDGVAPAADPAPELFGLRKDRWRFPVEIIQRPFETPEGRSVLYAISDIGQRKRAEEAMRLKEERYRDLVENVRDCAIILLDPDGRITSWNAGAEAIMGYRPDEVLGGGFERFYTEEDLNTGKPRRLLQRAREGRIEDEGWLLHKDGSRFWGDVVISSIRDASGQLTGFWKITKDLSNRKASDQKIREKEALLRQVIDLVPYPIFAKDPEGRFLFANKSCATRMGFAPEELVGRRQEEVTPLVTETQRFLDTDRQVLETRRPLYFVEETFTDREGNVTILQTSKAPLLLSGGQTAVLGVAVDITATKRAEAELAHQALHDPLTGLPNRALFLEHLERSLLRAKRHPQSVFAVLFLDLDRFKIVNDSLGHIAGDELLTLTAERLRSSTRQGDTIARLGGDEFAVLVDDLQSFGEAMDVALRILNTLKKPLKVGNRQFVVTASIGIAPGRGDYAGPKEILRDADTAMYKAKELGRNRCAVFDTAMHRQAVALLDLETDLRNAVHRNEFELHYQEIRSLAEGDLTGYEALLRWRHPTDGLRIPAQFLRLADETGILNDVGWWVLREACQQMSRWVKTHSSPLSVSVNLGGGQFTDSRLTERVAAALEEHKLSPSRLKLEITETAIMESEALTASRLRELSSLGVGVEIDDFGTGYSSLSRLLHLPITAMKIDRTFIDSLKRGTDAAGIVQSIVHLAHSLKLNVVAEGIETAEQLARLREAGCDYGQGFYFSRPVSSLTVRKRLWISRYNCPRCGAVNLSG